MAYDNDNIFAKILRGELPCNKIYEDDHVLSFHDINPLTPVHALVIPKGAYMDFDDFTANGSDAEITAFFRAAGQIARDLGVVEGGYRMTTNNGEHAGQIVPHFHVHIFGGRDLKHDGMVRKPE